MYEDNATDCLKLEERVVTDDEYFKYEMKLNKWGRDRKYGLENGEYKEPENPMLTFFQKNCPFPKLNSKEK
jgi:hypothetical protein